MTGCFHTTAAISIQHVACSNFMMQRCLMYGALLNKSNEISQALGKLGINMPMQYM